MTRAGFIQNLYFYAITKTTSDSDATLLAVGVAGWPVILAA